MLLRIKQAIARIWPVTIKQYYKGLEEQTKRLEYSLTQQAENTQCLVGVFSTMLQEQTEVVGQILREQGEMMSDGIQRQMEMMEHLLQKQTEVLRELIKFQTGEVSKGMKRLEMLQEEQNAKMQDDEMSVQIVNAINSVLDSNAKLFEKMYRDQKNNEGYVQEILWAEIFESATKNTTWLTDKTFSPGRWAVGYPFLYIMYRILNEVKPRKVLELGLGQSTKMIAQYADNQGGVEHIIVEDNSDWIDFFTMSFLLPPCSKIELCETEMVGFRDSDEVRVYKDLFGKLRGKMFDFIVIDAPMGGDMKQYSRIDILQLLPECLDKGFVILIDDCQRVGEQHTVMEIERILNQRGIAYKKGKYSGRRDSIVICDESLKFLITM